MFGQGRLYLQRSIWCVHGALYTARFCRHLFCVLLQSMAMRRVHDLNTMCFSQRSLVQNVELHGNLI